MANIEMSYISYFNQFRFCIKDTSCYKYKVNHPNSFRNPLLRKYFLSVSSRECLCITDTREDTHQYILNFVNSTVKHYLSYITLKFTFTASSYEYLVGAGSCIEITFNKNPRVCEKQFEFIKLLNWPLWRDGKPSLYGRNMPILLKMLYTGCDG